MTDEPNIYHEREYIPIFVSTKLTANPSVSESSIAEVKPVGIVGGRHQNVRIQYQPVWRWGATTMTTDSFRQHLPGYRKNWVPRLAQHTRHTFAKEFTYSLFYPRLVALHKPSGS